MEKKNQKKIVSFFVGLGFGRVSGYLWYDRMSPPCDRGLFWYPLLHLKNWYWTFFGDTCDTGVFLELLDRNDSKLRSIRPNNFKIRWFFKKHALISIFILIIINDRLRSLSVICDNLGTASWSTAAWEHSFYVEVAVSSICVHITLISVLYSRNSTYYGCEQGLEITLPLSYLFSGSLHCYPFDSVVLLHPFSLWNYSSLLILFHQREKGAFLR